MRALGLGRVSGSAGPWGEGSPPCPGLPGETLAGVMHLFFTEAPAGSWAVSLGKDALNVPAGVPGAVYTPCVTLGP